MELAVISGKGGTGKSSISAALATLDHSVVLADCDVDAANLYILFKPVHETEEVYVSGETAVIDETICTQCGLCIDYCRFDAISETNHKVSITETSCDGCQLCSRICPTNAIHMVKNDKSRMYSGNFRNGKMVYGRLAPGEENSGKLVNLVREKARQLAKKEAIETIIIDGPPGIGCPVISTITGVDHVLISTEPTLSGLMDLKRTLEVTAQFSLKTWVLINKYDLNLEMTRQIEAYCDVLHVPVVGKLPFNPQVVQAMVNCQSVTEYDAGSDFAKGVRLAYNKIIHE